MDNKQDDEFLYPSTLEPMLPPPPPPRTYAPAGASRPLEVTVGAPQKPAADEFSYPSELKPMMEATAAPKEYQPYEGYKGKVQSAAFRGVPFTAANIFATVPDLYQSGVDLIKSGYETVFPSILQKPKEKEGPKPYSLTNVPFTSEMLKKKMEPYVYQPQTEEEAKIARQTEAGLTGAIGIGKFKALPTMARFGLGYGSQTAAEELSDLFPQAAMLPAIAMMGGEGFASAVKGLRDSDRIMANKIKDAYDLDVRNGKIDPSRLDPNTPILEAAPPGSALRRLITEESKTATSFPQEIEDFNLRVTDPQKVPKLKQETNNLFGTIVARPMGQSAEVRDLVKVVDEKDVDKVYDIARNFGPAASIDPQVFGGLEQLPVVQEVEATVRQNIASIPSPQKRARYAVPDQNQNGNLAYWDAVYRQLREDGRSKARDPATAAAASNSADAATMLRDTLDQYTTVNGQSLYGNARNRAHEYFGAVDSLDVGAKFYTSTPRSAVDFQDTLASFSALSPDQRALARYGFLDTMSQDIGRRGFTDIANNLMDETTPFAQKAKLALAKPVLDRQGRPTGQLDFTDYDIVRGKILKSSVEENLRPVTMSQTANQPGFFDKNVNKASVAFAAAPAVVGTFSNILQDFAFFQGFMSPSFLATQAAAAATAFGLKLTVSARNNAMKRAANDVLLHLSTGNVRDLQALSELTRTNPFADAFFKQLQSGLRASQISEVPQPQRATGGRVARANGGRIEIQQGVRALMRAMDDAKKSVTKSTENLLQMPDEHIAQTLEAAKRNI